MSWARYFGVWINIINATFHGNISHILYLVEIRKYELTVTVQGQKSCCRVWFVEDKVYDWYSCHGLEDITKRI